MPKEMIQLGRPPLSIDNPEFQMWVGWNRDMDVQVGIGIPEDRDDAKGLRSPALVEVLYGTDQSLLAIGEWLAQFARTATEQDMGTPIDESDTGGWDYDEERLRENALSLLGRMAEVQPYRDVWWHPTRVAINNLIRILRKARDAAYGKDA